MTFNGENLVVGLFALALLPVIGLTGTSASSDVAVAACARSHRV